jgi:hypothetical protein
MAIASWPEGVNYAPDRDSWSQRPYLPPIASEMDGGNQRRRGRPGDKVRIIQQSVAVDADDYTSALEPFLIANKARRVVMPVFSGSDFMTSVVQIDDVEETFRGVDQVVVKMTLRVYRAVTDLEIGGTPELTATENQPYSFQATATGGVPPYAFSLGAGTLPAGITVNAETGVVSGTPTETGSFEDLKIRLTDARDVHVDLGPFTLVVS